jgi:chemotaxis signal transduction protein
MLQDQGGAAPMTALKCVMQGELVAVPVDIVAQIIEYEVGSLPLARAWVGGIGMFEGRVVLSLRPVSAQVAPGARATKAILLAHETSTLRWAVEVDSVLELVSLESLAWHQPRVVDLSRRWLPEEAPAEGGTLLRLDAAAMLREIGGAEASSR